MRIAIAAWGFVLLMLMAGAASAADVNGKWKASFETPNGTRETVFDFKADGNKLTGTAASGNGQTEISEGQINGDEISFVVTREIGGNEMKLHYKGTVGAQEIKMTVQLGERSFEMVAKKI
ncbi:MAG: hypothetical protein M1541_00090 [Acidobacteria bacterium]|nr:hypothetical protein [Acidobacteriota bacterium]